jgi:hypothetical protein
MKAGLKKHVVELEEAVEDDVDQVPNPNSGVPG